MFASYNYDLSPFFLLPSTYPSVCSSSYCGNINLFTYKCIIISFFYLSSLHSCFISQFEALVGAFLTPILVVIAINMIFFICVIVVVSRHTKEKADQTKWTVTKKQILRIMFSISGVLFLFGLTWAFFILTFSVSGLREMFQILFTIFNSLQGFFVFAFILFTKDLATGRPYYLVKSTDHLSLQIILQLLEQAVYLQRINRIKTCTLISAISPNKDKKGLF